MRTKIPRLKTIEIYPDSDYRTLFNYGPYSVGQREVYTLGYHCARALALLLTHLDWRIVELLVDWLNDSFMLDPFAFYLGFSAALMAREEDDYSDRVWNKLFELEGIFYHALEKHIDALQDDVLNSDYESY